LPFARTFPRLFSIATILFVTAASSVHVAAQPKKGSYGLTASLSTGYEGPSGIRTVAGPLHAGFAYSASDRMSLRGTIGFRSNRDTSGQTDSEFYVGAALWHYLNASEQVTSFVGGGIAFGSASHPNGSTTSLVAFQAFFGAEYWFSQCFAWHCHTGLGVGLNSVNGKSASDIYLTATTGMTWYL